ncbi:hypothetical protein G8S21_05180 [Clostridium botulinum C]|uniref:hypothetical protein n=1 Tax=Clostridium botulinum TaxID=1491 RepID=UPI001E2C7138|nr:hypothetical protein [Clostridium botulinum]MCD3245343.1 hypothetical protein [Clostridium botulinum C]MCD3261722.1 hypothetical protein [Clostridium botulinum C]
MQTLIKKFKVKSNENILMNKDVFKAIESTLGDKYSNLLKEGHPIITEITVLFDNDTSVKIKSYEEQEVEPQDTIEGVFTYPKNSISELIATKSTSGVLLLKVD